MSVPVPGSASDSRRKWWVGLYLALLLLSGLGNVIQGYKGNQSQNNHHASTVTAQKIQMQKDDYQIKLLKEVVVLTKEVKTSQTDHSATLIDIKNLDVAVDSVIAQLPAADTYISGQVSIVKGQLAAICASTGADCP